MAPTDRKIRNWIKGNVSTSRWNRFVDIDIAVIRKMCEWYAKQAVEQAVKAERERYTEFVEFFNDFVENSHGIAGWHRNGDIAEWGEFEIPEIKPEGE